MKKLLSIFLVLLWTASGCTSQGRMVGDPTAVFLGAQVGGMAGALIGGSGSHSYHGSQRGSLVGALVGTVVGAAVASAVTAPAVENDPYAVESNDVYDVYVQRPRVSRAERGYSRHGNPVELSLRNIRFIDDSRDRAIESGERAKIIFEVYNRANVAAYRVTPVVVEKTGVKNLWISSSVTLECIPAGKGIRYTATVRAGKLKKKERTALFQLLVLDGRGETVAVREFCIPLRR